MSAGDGNPILSPGLREGYQDGVPSKSRRHDQTASTGTSAAAMRVLSARLLAFYFRAPVKAFFRARVDYMRYARAINPRVQAGESWSWRVASPAILAHAIKTQGWGFLPNQVLPPLLANTAVGAVLYTSHLHVLGLLHEPSSRATNRVYPPPPVSSTFTAGFAAGAIQSLIAAPLDALQVRFQTSEMMEGKYRNMWQYAFQKSRKIGLRGVFAGFTLSIVRDSFGFGLFFAAFEYVKGQCFYGFVSNFYGFYDRLSHSKRSQVDAQSGQRGRPEIRPHYMLEPIFILMAGAAASIAQSIVQHPLQRVQDIHWGRLEWIDSHSQAKGASKAKTLRLYASAYRKTLKECAVFARRAGGLRRWLYADFFMGTLRQVPSTSAGLIVFEILRRKYSINEEVVRIEKDGYDILLV